MDSKLIVAIGISAIIASLGAPAASSSPLLHLRPADAPSLLQRTGPGESVRSWFDWVDGGDAQRDKPAIRKPARQKPAARKQGRITCNAAAQIVAGYAFSEVKPVSCSGGSYVFQAKRQDKAFSITLSARNGDLIKVKKTVVTASR